MPYLDKCKDCRWWVLMDNRGWQVPLGQCRLNPPAPMSAEYKQSQYPLTHGDDWCSKAEPNT